MPMMYPESAQTPGHSLGLNVIAENTETDVQRDCLGKLIPRPPRQPAQASCSGLPARLARQAPTPESKGNNHGKNFAVG